LRLTQESRSLRHIHLPALDGVRLLAVALVILHHVTSGSRDTFLLHLVGMQHGQAQDNEILGQEAKLVDTFKAGGMNVITPDLESFRKPVLASLPAKFEAKWGKGLWEKIAAA